MPKQSPDTAPSNGWRPEAWQVAGLVLVLAVSGLLLYAFWPAIAGTAEEDDPRELAEDPPESAAQVDAIVVEPRSFPLRAEATGRLHPWREAVISAEGSGRIIQRNVEEGQPVQEGTLLFRLDDRDEQIELEEARAELLQAQAEYAAETRGSDEITPADTAQLSQARQALQQAEAAFEAGELTEGELREARRRFDAAQILSGSEREAVQAARSGLAQAEQRLERARLALSRTHVTAPFSGRVADLEVDVGRHVSAGEELMTLLQDRPMRVRVDVLEEDLVQTQPGATARVRIPSLGGLVVEGQVHSVNPQVDSEAGTGRVTVAVPNSDGRLVSGLFAEVALETGRLEDRLVVPAEAVLVRQGRDLVFRIENGRAEWVYVELGARSGDFVEIVDGIAPGDTVAVDGHFALAHDAPAEVGEVRPLGEL